MAIFHPGVDPNSAVACTRSGAPPGWDFSHGFEFAAGVATRWRAHPLQPRERSITGISLARGTRASGDWATGPCGIAGAALLLILTLRFRHPPLIDRWEPLDAARKMWAVVALLIFSAVLHALAGVISAPEQAPTGDLGEAGRIDVHDHGGFGNFLRRAEIQAAAERLRERGALRRFQQKLKTIFVAQTRERRGRGAEDFYAAIFERREIGRERARPADGVFDFAVAHQNAGERGERRIVQHPAEMRFFLVERYVILLRGVLNRVVLGIVRFHEHFARQVRRARRGRPPA